MTVAMDYGSSRTTWPRNGPQGLFELLDFSL